MPHRRVRQVFAEAVMSIQHPDVEAPHSDNHSARTPFLRRWTVYVAGLAEDQVKEDILESVTAATVTIVFLVSQSSSKRRFMTPMLKAERTERRWNYLYGNNACCRRHTQSSLENFGALL